jgi:S1-C subfamily serine protease
MTIWKTALLTAALVLAAGLGAAIAPPGQAAQTVVTRTPKQRALEIFAGGSRIGVSIRDVEASDAKAAKGASTGVVVEDVSSESPAEKAGIRKGDVIVEFDGERVRSARQLTRLVQETPAGRAVQVALLRDGQRTTLTVTPDEGRGFSFEGFPELQGLARDFPFKVAPRPPAPPAAPVPPTPPTVWRFDELLGRSSYLGITVDTLSPQLAEYFGTKQGVLVSSVADNSAAAKAGIKAGDVITSINGSTVDAPADVRRAVQALRDGDEFTVVVTRDRKSVTLKGKAERPERRRTSRTII